MRVALVILVCSAHQRGVWENTAYQDDGGLFLHSIAEWFPSRIQIKYPAEPHEHEHDALLLSIAAQVRMSCVAISPRSPVVSSTSVSRGADVYVCVCVCVRQAQGKEDASPTACRTLGDPPHGKEE